MENGTVEPRSSLVTSRHLVPFQLITNRVEATNHLLTPKMVVGNPTAQIAIDCAQFSCICPQDGVAQRTPYERHNAFTANTH